MTLQEIITKFDNPKKSGSGYQVKCPAHEDRVASLSISNGGGKILLHCHAGCSADSIVGAIGIRLSDLFSDPRPGNGSSALYLKGSPVVAIYVYKDVHGEAVYRVLRSAKKDFAQQRLENGEWIWKGPETKLLYRLPDLAADDSSQPVFIVEGEKDVDNLWKIGVLATCNSGGAGKFAQDNSVLQGRQIVIIPDNDDPGRAHAADVARKLKGIAETILILDLPELVSKGDVSDWISAGGSKDELLRLVDESVKSEKTPNYPKNDFFPSQTLLRPDELTLMGLAARFHERFYRETRYMEARKAYYNYREGVWAASQCEAEVKTKKIINEVHDEVKKVEKKVKDLQDKLAAGRDVADLLGKTTSYLANLEKFSTQIKKPLTMGQILDFARSDLVIGADDFDPDHAVLNVHNGSIDLETGKFRPHNPLDLCSMQSGVDYVADAKCERWIKFLEDIFLGDQSLVGFMKRMMGYCLSGYTSEQIFLILYGDGSNGKSELLWVIDQLMGSYVRTANVDTFMDDKSQGGHNEDIARLRGCRVVTTTETEKSKRLAEGLVKRLTGGDVITASYKHERTFQFTPRFKVLLAANHKPNIAGTDFGMWRRIYLLPFLAKFLKPGVELAEKQFRIDPNLRADLRKELPGILNWCVEGYQEWRKQGLNPPDVVKAASEAYRIESDKLGSFLGDCMIQGKGMKADFSAVYAEYSKWCEEGGMKPQSKIALSKDMAARGMEIKRATGERRTTTLIDWGLLA